MGAQYSTKPLNLRQNMLWNAFGSMCNLGCQWLMSILIVRLSDDYIGAGLFALAMSVYGIFLPIAQYRMYIYQISDTKQENTPGEYLAFRVITCAVALILCTLYAALTCSLGAVTPIVLYGLYKTANQVIDVLHAADQVHERMDYIGKSLCLQGVGALICFVGIFSLTKNLNLTLVAMTIAVAFVGVFYDLPRTKSFGPIRFGITAKKIRILATSCLPIVIAGIAFSAAPQLPKQFLFMISGDSALGVYASVAAPIAIIQMGVSYIYYPLLPHLASSYEKRDLEHFKKFMVKLVVAIAILGAGCALLLEWLAAPILVLMYGESISGYTYLVQPLLLSAITTGCCWFINDLLIALRSFKAVLIASIVELVVALAASVPLITLFDMNGVTFATIAACLASILVMAFALIFQIRKKG